MSSEKMHLVSKLAEVLFPNCGFYFCVIPLVNGTVDNSSMDSISNMTKPSIVTVMKNYIKKREEEPFHGLNSQSIKN